MQTQVKPLSLSEILMSLNGGGSVEEIQTKIRDVADAVQATGNTGAITIKLSMARNGGDGSNQIVIKDTVTVAMPKVPKPATLFFVTDDGSLSRQNPDQAMFEGLGVK